MTPQEINQSSMPNLTDNDSKQVALFRQFLKDKGALVTCDGVGKEEKQKAFDRVCAYMAAMGVVEASAQNRRDQT